VKEQCERRSLAACCASDAVCQWASAREDLSHNSRRRNVEEAGRIASGDCFNTGDMLCQTFRLTPKGPAEDLPDNSHDSHRVMSVMLSSTGRERGRISRCMMCQTCYLPVGQCERGSRAA